MEKDNRKVLVAATEEMIVKPDTACITTMIKGKANSFTEASSNGVIFISSAKQLMAECGVEEDNIKISRMSITEDMIRVEKEATDKKNKTVTTEYEYKTVGYKYSTRIIVKLPIDDERVAKLYTKIVCSNLFSESRVSYTLEEDEKYRDELLKRVTEKARHKADVIAEAAGKKVVGLKKAVYGASHPTYSKRGFNGSLEMCAMGDSIGSSVSNVIGSGSAEDITISESIQASFDIA